MHVISFVCISATLKYIVVFQVGHNCDFNVAVQDRFF